MVRSEKMFHEPAEFKKELEEIEGFIRSNTHKKTPLSCEHMDKRLNKKD